MKRIVTIKYVLILVVFLVLISMTNVSKAAIEYPNLNDGWFYIKNAYTGHYLDVYNGLVQAGTNVQQCQYNGTSAQKWFISHRGNGEYMICSEVGSYKENGIKYVTYALDVDNGTNANGTQIHLWNAAIDGITQTFSFEKTVNETYIIRTKCSNHTKVVSLADNLCNDGINVHQWEYSNHSHDQWILEPVEVFPTMGIDYAIANHHARLDAFPDFTASFGGDCTNFVSQCLLAGGWHQTADWYIKRKNTTNHTINTVADLNDSWNLADPSPWISAKEFKNHFLSGTTQYCKGQFILDNPDVIFALPFSEGDVIQYADNILGILGDARHSMYIRGFTTGEVAGKVEATFELTYHTTDTEKIDLFSVAENHKSSYFIFYDFTN